MDNSETVISIDVEWAHPEVLADVVRLLDEREIRATFFCTHQGIKVPGHERALHPNFRRSRNSPLSSISTETLAADSPFYRFVVSATRAFCPEAVGVRAHSLFFDTDLLTIYRDAGLEYDSSSMLPLAPDLAPVWRGSGILELPAYYMDHWDLREQATGLDLTALRLGRRGLKVLVFHPNLIYLNATTESDYEDSRPRYDDPEWLLAHRNSGNGVRAMFVKLLDWLTQRESPPVLSDLNERWRTANADTVGASTEGVG
jgi:hypothetical protein